MVVAAGAFAVAMFAMAIILAAVTLIPTAAALVLCLGVIISILNLWRKGLIIIRMIRRLQAGSQRRSCSNLCSKSPLCIAGAQVGTSCQQLLYNSLITIISSQVQRRLAISIPGIHIGTSCQQKRNERRIRLNPHGSQIRSQIHLILQKQRSRRTKHLQILTIHNCIQKFLNRLIKIIRVQVSNHLSQFLRLHARLFILLKSHAVPLQITHAANIPYISSIFQHNVRMRTLSDRFQHDIPRPPMEKLLALLFTST